VKDSYWLGEDYVSVERAYRPHTYNVLSLWVDPDLRGQGRGSRLMEAVCRDADEAGVELWLVPMAVGDGPKQDHLERFYQRLGFDKRGGYMIRQPKGAACVSS
jgi:GNAT superfamily N-acetyltransferase